MCLLAAGLLVVGFSAAVVAYRDGERAPTAATLAFGTERSSVTEAQTALEAPSLAAGDSSDPLGSPDVLSAIEAPAFAPEQGGTLTSPAASTILTAFEAILLDGHNIERATAGAGPVGLDAVLVETARQRARDMAAADYFSHTSPWGETAFTVLDRLGYRYTIAGENIARNNYPEAQSAGVAMSGFMTSPSHRSNLLDMRFNGIGIGSAVGRDGMKYFVVVLAGSR